MYMYRIAGKFWVELNFVLLKNDEIKFNEYFCTAWTLITRTWANAKFKSREIFKNCVLFHWNIPAIRHTCTVYTEYSVQYSVRVVTHSVTVDSIGLMVTQYFYNWRHVHSNEILGATPLKKINTRKWCQKYINLYSTFVNACISNSLTSMLLTTPSALKVVTWLHPSSDWSGSRFHMATSPLLVPTARESGETEEWMNTRTCVHVCWYDFN